MRIHPVLKTLSLAFLGIIFSALLSMTVVSVVSEKTVNLSTPGSDIGFELAPDGAQSKRAMKNSASNENPIVATVGPDGKVHLKSGPRPSAETAKFVPNNKDSAKWDD
jgi:hypothetical protein